ncbi:FAD-binding oxidoreductase [Streptomyces physcomitrii]|uniref:FAD-binding oxidoreductase n=1 Tax=Streptomyces physcomitrii TaxID=2724184 RepID=A0ABX1H9M5_9ACTN|nr:FAD-binding oxidoreductase [Streptomyces physcomitrii]NKI44763.1 FAD-binding oxidoreductase [Streptomyces physcomitrii]
MERRRVLEGLGGLGLGSAALATGAATAACRPSGTGADGASTPPGDPKGTATRTAASSAPADWKALASDLDGLLVRPGDKEWATARQLYNTRFDALKPTAVAYVAHLDDIRTTLAYARAHRIPLAIRNGGHSYAGYSSGDGRLILDVSRLATVRVSGKEAVVGAGAKLMDVYRGLSPRGVTIPAGSCPTVGISGLTLGGGHGVASRAYGLTCDSLISATVMTAAGKQLTAGKDENPDLFWALRGAGGGNFGVVTELRFRTHDAPEGVSAFLSWPFSRAAAVVKAWQEWGPAQPDEIWSSLHLDNTEGGTPTVSVAAFSLGSYGDLQNAVDRLADRVGAPARSVSLKRRAYQAAMDVYAGCSGYSDAMCHLPGETPGRNRAGALGRETYAARSDFFDRSLSAAGIQALLDRIQSVRGGSGAFSLTALGGAINRVDPGATAFVHRRSRFLAQYTGAWRAGSSGTTVESWLRSTHTAMRRHASGAAYQNYIDPRLDDWRGAYYGTGAARLAQVKKKYDPERFFSFGQGL